MTSEIAHKYSALASYPTTFLHILPPLIRVLSTSWKRWNIIDGPPTILRFNK